MAFKQSAEVAVIKDPAIMHRSGPSCYNVGDLGLLITHNLNIDGTVALPVAKQLSIFSTWVLNGNVSTVNCSYNSFSV